MSLFFLGSFAPLAADLVVVIGALSLLVADVVLPAGEKRILALGTAATLLAALCATFAFDLTGSAFGGTYVGDPLATFLKQLFLIGGLFGCLGSTDDIAQRTPRRQGEYGQLLLYSVLGMSLLAGARDILLLVVAFELMGIPLYALTAWEKDRRRSVEGALKFFLVGATSSVTLMFGLALLSGLAGSTSISVIGTHIASHGSPIVLLGLVMTLCGVAYKLGVFPFHFWVPDTYQSARTPLVAFISVAPKVAGVAVLIRLLSSGGGAFRAKTILVLLFLTAATLLAGNMLALNQTNVKRLLGYSGVAQIGFVLMGLVAGTSLGLEMTLFYLLAYLFTNMGIFFVVHAVQAAGGNDELPSFAGLGRRNGWLSFAMLLFLLSLAGIPFVVGFWAKLFVFLAAWEAGLHWLVILAAVLSVVALFYYLRIARSMFMEPPPEDTPIRVDSGVNVVIGVCLAFVVLMGLLPGGFVQIAEHAAASTFASGLADSPPPVQEQSVGVQERAARARVRKESLEKIRTRRLDRAPTSSTRLEDGRDVPGAVSRGQARELKQRRVHDNHDDHDGHNH